MATNKEMLIHGVMTPVVELNSSAAEIDAAVPKAMGAVQRSGDTMTGNLVINTAEDTGRTILIDANTFAIFAKVLGKNHAQVVTNAANNTLWFNWSTDGGAYFAQNQVLHTGNKPSGSYTGNGSVAERTINIGGIGKNIVVGVSNSFAIVNAYGALIKYGTNIEAVNNSVAKFVDGVLTLATNHSSLNASGTYTYHVI